MCEVLSWYSLLYRAGVRYDLSGEVSKRHLMILLDVGARPLPMYTKSVRCFATFHCWWQVKFHNLSSTSTSPITPRFDVLNVACHADNCKGSLIYNGVLEQPRVGFGYQIFSNSPFKKYKPQPQPMWRKEYLRGTHLYTCGIPSRCKLSPLIINLLPRYMYIWPQVMNKF